jgi:small subunit ribosomal protein S4
MANVCRQCRQQGTKLFLKGARCLSPKCALTRRNYRPGSPGAKSGGSLRKSEFGRQLLEKQKAKAEYGIRERQFAKIFKEASQAHGATGEVLLRLLEERLDNVVYRLGWASSRAQARQLVSHRYFTINDKIVNIPSMRVKPKDIIKCRKKIEIYKTTVPKWLKLDAKKTSAEVLREPLRTEIETDLDEQLIIEFYSR